MLLGVSALCLVLTACSNAQPTASTTTTVPGAPVPYDKAHNAHAAVAVAGPCTHIRGAWVLKGTVKNSAHTSHGYSLVVDFVTVPGNTVEHTQIVTVPNVAPSATASWQASWKSTVRDISCVVRQAQTS